MATRRTGLWLLTTFFFFLLLFTVFVWGLNRVLVGPASGVGRGTVLVIRLQGAIGEIAQRGPFVGAVTVREIDEALRRAATDSRVAAVFLEVGPVGGVFASLKARRTNAGSCSGCVASPVHLVKGRTISARSVRSCASSRMSLLPALSTSGVPPKCAL